MPILKKRVFLDHASITPLDPKVKKEMDKAESKLWANPASLHLEGEAAKKSLDDARVRVARILHSRSSEVYFTSGGTESLNIAISGIVKAKKEKWKEEKIKKTPHIIVSSIEHPAVLEPIKDLVKRGEAEASYIAPDQGGIISPHSVKRELKGNTVLVVIQHANNEIGTLQPVREISKIMDLTPLPPLLAKEREMGERTFPYLLVDASQSALYEDISMERLGADILVLDGIKMYGPRGMGILAVKKGVELRPTSLGGGQEGGLRSGTPNVPGALGLAKALEMAQESREKENKRLTLLRNYAIEKILKEIPGSSLNGSRESRLPNNINMCFPGQDSEFLVIKLDTFGFAVSAASACHTLSLENSSYVIESVSGKDCASSSLRFTLGRGTKKGDIDRLLEALKNIVK